MFLITNRNGVLRAGLRSSHQDYGFNKEGTNA